MGDAGVVGEAGEAVGEAVHTESEMAFVSNRSGGSSTPPRTAPSRPLPNAHCRPCNCAGGGGCALARRGGESDEAAAKDGGVLWYGVAPSKGSGEGGVAWRGVFVRVSREIQGSSDKTNGGSCCGRLRPLPKVCKRAACGT